jgi:hypothetical protein
MSLFSSAGGAFVKWDEPKKVAGDIVAFRMGTDANDNPAVLIDLDSHGDEVTVTVAQANLKRQFAETFGDVDSLSELDVYIGDHVEISFVKTEKLDGNRTLKIFEVVHTSKAAAAAAAPASML